ncbi:MAG: AmmeMemoRadiSam system protein B [Candidatus Omnitrophica bacterium]|nr:AmmeMemoRadiSam system protein B [Candidatus Omnitrophota bacterium]
MVRNPVVSGQFYQDKSSELSKEIEVLTPKLHQKTKALGLILPHAAYLYSGRVAATTVSGVVAKRRILILGPNHSGIGPDFSLWSKGAWRIPFGDIEIDEQMAQSILSKDDLIKEDQSAHLFEHSIEVQLPILKKIFGSFSFVPVCCQIKDLKTYEKAANQIYQGVRLFKEDLLLVASTDMTHYETDASARRKDRAALESIVGLDESRLLDMVSSMNISMCGVSAVAVFLRCCKLLGATKASVSLYETSAVASGDDSSVVGYAGVVVS